MPESKNAAIRTRTRTITQVAILIALEIILNRFASINTMGLKIGFSFIPMALCAMLFGPLWAAAAYGLSDFLGAILFPLGPYHPGFTICAMLMGLTLGLFLYRDAAIVSVKRPTVTLEVKLNWVRVRFFPNYLVPALINTLVLGLLLNTVWISQLYGSKTYWGWFVYRLSEYAVLLPLNLVLLPLLSKLAATLKKAGLA